jgi:hypothetical protein
VSLFWTTVFGLMNTDCIATAAYSPRIDGQSERTNPVVEIALRHQHHDDWVDHLGMIQLAMNNSQKATTERTPKELLMGFLPRAAIDIPTDHLARQGKKRDATKRVTGIQIMPEEANDAIKFTEFTMASAYDKGHQISDIRVGDKVCINLAKKGESGYSASGINAPKLQLKRVSPLLGTEKASDNDFRVDIPTDWKIWPIISVRHLMKASVTFTRNTHRTTKLEDEQREIEVVLDVRINRGRKAYFVKFVRLPITRCD